VEHDRIVAEQIEYYRERAPEYDEWYMREGLFAERDDKAEWFAEVELVRGALDEFGPSGRILELASGTGWWTERLAEYTDDLTCVDASVETTRLARGRAPKATFVQADIFAWTPERVYDVVFFSFWLSHVPASRFDEFWDLVAGALAPGGRVFFIDSYAAEEFQRPGDPDRVVVRRLNDGREFNAIKNNYEPAALAARLRAGGWSAQAATTGKFFYYGSASR
jgi:demethylmenaquinone methyltransferase/2-methoxy-6-polyprenyl-1,4-benzoquinol methylase